MNDNGSLDINTAIWQSICRNFAFSLLRTHGEYVAILKEKKGDLSEFCPHRTEPPSSGLYEMKVRGIVEFYSNEGFGFIQTDHCPKKVYVNESGVHKAGYQNLRMGQIVLFNIEAPQNERRKPTAFNLEIVVPDDNYPDYRFGKVLWFNPERSFGFITPDYIGDNLYVHMVEVEGAGLKTLYKDERVRFIPYPSSRSNKLFVATYLTLLQTKVQSSQYMARVA